jgi:HPt (histidine-containing phosphotransfer) domain-containing protein
MKEMFIEKGFNDYLAKPIDISRLDEILGRWIPREKRVMGNREQETENRTDSERKGKTTDNYNCSLLDIPGIDTAKGIAMTGGTEAGYRQVLAMFGKDAQERLSFLLSAPNSDALPAFVTQVHALKSASASIGAGEVSALAANLETAGNAGDLDFIREKLPGFAEILMELIENIRATLKLEELPLSPITAGNSQPAAHLLHGLAEALKSKMPNAIDRILEELNQQPLDVQTKEALGIISDQVLIAEYGSALEITCKLIKTQQDTEF